MMNIDLTLAVDNTDTPYVPPTDAEAMAAAMAVADKMVALFPAYPRREDFATEAQFMRRCDQMEDAEDEAVHDALAKLVIDFLDALLGHRWIFANLALDALHAEARAHYLCHWRWVDGPDDMFFAREYDRNRVARRADELGTDTPALS